MQHFFSQLDSNGQSITSNSVASLSSSIQQTNFATFAIDSTLVLPTSKNNNSPIKEFVPIPIIPLIPVIPKVDNSSYSSLSPRKLIGNKLLSYKSGGQNSPRNQLTKNSLMQSLNKSANMKSPNHHTHRKLLLNQSSGFGNGNTIEPEYSDATKLLLSQVGITANNNGNNIVDESILSNANSRNNSIISDSTTNGLKWLKKKEVSFNQDIASYGMDNTNSVLMARSIQPNLFNTTLWPIPTTLANTSSLNRSSLSSPMSDTIPCTPYVNANNVQNEL